MDDRFLLIVGLQKSGTTLLSRLMEMSEVIAKPFKSEGDDFWGNEPAFSPTAYPAGAAYQKHNGERGHEMSDADADANVVATMRERLAKLNCGVLFNKNPYNTVRLPWLRAVFPKAHIVAMIRNPLANAYSLAKKYLPHDGQGKPPMDGWWGVKPAGWRALVQDDKIVQSARQWSAVNEVLRRDAPLADQIIPYDQLCAAPKRIAEDILSRVLDKPVRIAAEIPEITCLDGEYHRGSSLRSKNRLFKETKSLAIAEEAEADLEIEPLTDQQRDNIAEICGPTASRLGISA